MMKDPKRDVRAALQSARIMLEAYEGCGLISASKATSLRYKMAVRAGDVNPAGCQFPRCNCSWPDCSTQRPFETGVPATTRL
jgi:hypothetical protein